MGRNDWYRNSEWSSEIEEAFFSKLARARDKSQYLRIQACTLAEGHPAVALRLLDQYFSLGGHFDEVQAHVDRARALLALGAIEQAIAAFEAALDNEQRKPHYQTQAYLELPLLVATRRIDHRYEQAIEILRCHKDRLTFPLEHFKWHAANALILYERGDRTGASNHARKALEAASVRHSGMQYHPQIGLVGEGHDELKGVLSAMVK